MATMRANSPCKHPSCGKLVQGIGYCPKHVYVESENKKQKEKTRESASARGYSSQWRKARIGYLAKHPLCTICNDNGRIVAGNVVDHIKPHLGDKGLFWDSDNWQTLCASCHGRKTAREDGGFGNRSKIT
jgi:5-methylcytosine-specific restriction enzyme A